MGVHVWIFLYSHMFLGSFPSLADRSPTLLFIPQVTESWTGAWEQG